MDSKIKEDNVVPVAEACSSHCPSLPFCRVARSPDLRLQLAGQSAVHTNQVPWD